MPRPSRAPLLVLLGSVLLFVAGVVLLLIYGWTQTASFGWYAYQPLPSSAFVPGAGGWLTPGATIGLVLALVGLIGIAGSVGFLLGRRVRGSR